MDDDIINKYKNILLQEIEECALRKKGYEGFTYWKDAMTERIKAYQHALESFNKLIGD